MVLLEPLVGFNQLVLVENFYLMLVQQCGGDAAAIDFATIKPAAINLLTAAGGTSLC
jgi:hypothetical protein